uniref:KxDL domain-containing protein n=1 Tax=Elaeophora elaphi TaxID=1147741 RepID=A0A0R3S4Q3_9BILA
MISRKNDFTDGTGDRTDKRFARPTVLPLSHMEESTDSNNENGKHDEWYEMITAVTPPIDEINETDQKMNSATNDMLRKTMINGLDQIDLEPDNAAEIEALEQSLTALVDNFRSGRMCALDEEKLKMMRKARVEMENLTAFHVKLHKMQAPNFSTFSDNGQLDEQYDLLFRKLDKLHCFLYNMSFRATDVKEEGELTDTFSEGKDGE